MNRDGNSVNFFSYVCNGKKVNQLFASTSDRIPISVRWGAQIHDEVQIGAGAIIYQGVNLEKGAYIGPGSVVMQDVEEGQSVFGNPAQPLG